MSDDAIPAEARAFIPSLEQASSYVPLGDLALARRLLDEKPTERNELAAIVLRAAVLRRRATDDTRTMLLHEAPVLRTGEPPPPDAFVESTHRVRVGPIERSPDGTGHARVRVRVLEDRVVRVRDVYVPGAFRFIPGLFHFDNAITERIGHADPPAALAVELWTQSIHSAYRGASARKEPDFFGRPFGDTLEQARAELTALAKGGAVAKYELATHAWPITWLRYGEGSERRDLVLFIGADGVGYAYAG